MHDDCATDSIYRHFSIRKYLNFTGEIYNEFSNQTIARNGVIVALIVPQTVLLIFRVMKGCCRPDCLPSSSSFSLSQKSHPILAGSGITQN